MRGQPWLRALLATVAFALAALPLWRLTRTARGGAHGTAGMAQGEPAIPRVPAAMETAPLRVEVTFSAPPGEWALRHLGTVLLSGRTPGQTASGEWTVALPKEGVDLALQALLPPAGSSDSPSSFQPRAVRVLVTRPDGRVAADRTFWASPESGGELGEIVTVAPGGEANVTP